MKPSTSYQRYISNLHPMGCRKEGANDCVAPPGVFLPLQQWKSKIIKEVSTILLTDHSLWFSLKPQEILLVTYHKILRKVLEAWGRIFILTMEKVQVKSVNTTKRNIWWTLIAIFPPSQQCKGVFVLFGGDFFFFLNCLPLAKILYHKLNYISRDYQA